MSSPKWVASPAELILFGVGYIIWFHGRVGGFLHTTQVDLSVRVGLVIQIHDHVSLINTVRSNLLLTFSLCTCNGQRNLTCKIINPFTIAFSKKISFAWFYTDFYIIKSLRLCNQQMSMTLMNKTKISVLTFYFKVSLKS